MQEYIRNALPLFEPMEQEYSASVCDETFELLWRHGTYGDPRGWPRELRDNQVDFTFESPLHDVIEQQKGEKMIEASKLIGIAVGLDPAAGQIPDSSTMLRDALEGIGAPEKWMHSEAAAKDCVNEMQRQKMAQTQLDALEQGSKVAQKLGGGTALPAPAGA